MFHVVLVHPEIPPNTGNIIRLCANTGSRLHLIEPLGFAVDDAHLRRAGLDYHARTVVSTHAGIEAFLQAVAPARILATSAHGEVHYHRVRYRPGDALVFGPETRGLSRDQLRRLAPAATLRIPMRPANRSLNLSNAAAVVVFEAWRQLGFDGAT